MYRQIKRFEFRDDPDRGTAAIIFSTSMDRLIIDVMSDVTLECSMATY